MTSLISNTGGKVTVGDILVLTMSPACGLGQGGCEVRLASGRKGDINCTAPFLDCPPYVLVVQDQPIGELKITHPGQPDGRMRVLESFYLIESKGPWTLLMQDETEVSRITPAWRDSQVSQGVLAEVTSSESLDDWALAGFVFAWMAADCRARGIASGSLVCMLGMFSS